MRRVYHALGIEMTGDAVAAMEAEVLKSEDQGHNAHRAQVEAFDLGTSSPQPVERLAPCYSVRGCGLRGPRGAATCAVSCVVSIALIASPSNAMRPERWPAHSPRVAGMMPPYENFARMMVERIDHDWRVAVLFAKRPIA